MNESDRYIKENIIKATKWAAISNIIRKIVTPITNMILARLLTPEVFGIVASINIVISFADMLTDTGFQKFLIQHNFKNKKELFNSANIAFWTNLIMSCVLWIIVVFFSESLAILVGSKGNEKLLMFAALSIPLSSFSSVQYSIFRRKFDFKTTFVPQLVGTILPFFITIPFAFYTKSPWSLVVGTVVTRLSDAILLTVLSEWKPSFYYRFNELLSMLSFGMWTILESFSVWITTNIDVFIIGNLMTEYYVGIYKTSINSIVQIMSIVTAIILPVLFSTLSRIQNDKGKMLEVIYSFQVNSAFFILPMSIGMFIYGDVVVWVFLGKNWTEATTLISLLALFEAPVILIAHFATEVYRASGEPKISFIIQISFLFIVSIFTYIGALNGFEYLSKVKIILQVIFVIINLTILVFRYGFRLEKMLWELKEIILASVGMGIVGYFLHSISNSMMTRFITIFPCIIFYMAFCLIMPKTKLVMKQLIGK